MAFAHTLLIVDDEPKICQALRRTLHREPYEILYAESGEAALELLARQPVDVLIADENMPGMRGSVLLARCKQQWPEMVRMMLTGDARLETVVAAVNRGEIFRFFIKPCDEAELIVSIRDALQMRALKQAASQLLSTVKKQGETIRTMSGRDGSVVGMAPVESPPIVLASRTPGGPRSLTGHSAPSGLQPEPGRAAGAPEGAGDSVPASSDRPGVFHLGAKDIPEDVDGLLDEIRRELEKLGG